MTATEPAPDDVAAPAGPELLHGCPLAESHGQSVVHCTAEQYLDLLTALKADGFELCSDVTAVDYLGHPDRFVAGGVEPERFEVVVSLIDMNGRRRIRVRCQVPAGHPIVPTLFGLWPGTEALEREIFDLMGIRFADHPDMTRILMPEDWEGHPLRKDYAVGRIPVQFKGAPPAR